MSPGYHVPVEPDANGDKWVLIKGVKYDEARRVLRSKATTIRDLTAQLEGNPPDLHRRQPRLDGHLLNSARARRAVTLFNALPLRRHQRAGPARVAPDQPRQLAQDRRAARRKTVAHARETRSTAPAAPSKEVDKLGSAATTQAGHRRASASRRARSPSSRARWRCPSRRPRRRRPAPRLRHWLDEQPRAGGLRATSDVARDQPGSLKKNLQQHAGC
jgi:hypothetical protein